VWHAYTIETADIENLYSPEMVAIKKEKKEKETKT